MCMSMTLGVPTRRIGGMLSADVNPEALLAAFERYQQINYTKGSLVTWKPELAPEDSNGEYALPLVGVVTDIDEVGEKPYTDDRKASVFIHGRESLTIVKVPALRLQSCTVEEANAALLNHKAKIVERDQKAIPALRAFELPPTVKSSNPSKMRGYCRRQLVMLEGEVCIIAGRARDGDPLVFTYNRFTETVDRRNPTWASIRPIDDDELTKFGIDLVPADLEDKAAD